MLQIAPTGLQVLRYIFQFTPSLVGAGLHDSRVLLVSPCA